MKPRPQKKIPVHPGEVLDELLQEMNITQTALANHIGVTQTYISDIINRKRNLSAAMACKLGAAVGLDAETWMNIQKNWELSQVDPKVAQGIKRLAA